MEAVRAPDGNHQALCQLPRNRGLAEANGPVWRPALYRYDSQSLEILDPALQIAINGILSRGPRKRLIISVGTLFRASQFLSEELPIRLAHRVQDLGELPDGLSEMPSIKKVQDWYAQSFEVCVRS